jgi:hypothetical protein
MAWAMIERAEFPVQRNTTLKTWGSNYRGSWIAKLL